MTSVGDFEREDFNAVAWVNSLCAQKPKENGETLDKFLSEMEMRLQLSAEEIEASLHDSSNQALRRIPYAVQEIYRLQGDIQGMQDRVKTISQQVAIDAHESNSSVVNIAQLDMVKRNVESASATLAEATELSSLFVKVEEVFAAGDLAVVASMLSSMRRSLSLVGDVPEFRAGRETLHTLEDRLQGMVEGQLSEALTQSGLARSALTSNELGAAEANPALDDRISTLCGLLMAVGRFGVIEQQFVATRVAMATRLWQGLLQQHAQQQPPPPPPMNPSQPSTMPPTRSVVGVASSSSWPPPQGPLHVWLAQAHMGLLAIIRAEAGWCGRVLPSHAHTLVALFMASVLALVRQSLTIAYERLPERTSTSANRPGTPKVVVLQAAAAETSKFAMGINGLLDASFGPSFDAQAKRQLLAAALQPLEDWVSHWAELENAQLGLDFNSALPSDLVQQLSAPGASTEDLEALFQRVGAGVRLARSHALQAIHRCEHVTGGSEVKAFSEALDLQLSSFVGRLVGLARALQHQANRDFGGAREGGVPPLLGCWMQMVVLAWEVGSGALVARVDAGIRASLSTSASTLQAAAARAKAEVLPDATALRMAAEPQQLQQVVQLAASMADPRSQLLPKTIAQVAALGDTVQAGALEVLLAHVREAVQPLPSMPEWAKLEDYGNAAPMPSFSAAPLPYITLVGEYLMLLPHHLMDALAAAAASEASISKGGADGISGQEASARAQEEEAVDVEDLAAQWLDSTVTAAAHVYAKAIAQVPHMTQQGGAQLAADAEYFCNVMSALHVVPPPNLLTIQAFAALPDDQFREAAASALDNTSDDTQVELTALRALSTARKIKLN